MTYEKGQHVHIQYYYHLLKTHITYYHLIMKNIANIILIEVLQILLQYTVNTLSSFFPWHFFRNTQ